MLTERLQIQVVKNCLNGEPFDLIMANSLTEPWLTCMTVMQGKANTQERTNALYSALGVPGLEENLKKFIAFQPGTTEVFKSLADISKDLKPVEWLWKSWIPRGLITLLGASGGAGKSVLSLDLARRIIQEKQWPDGSPIPNPGRSVIYVDAEGIPQVHNERATAWGMDKSKLYMLGPSNTRLLDFTSQEDKDKLIEMTTVIHPEIVFIDSLSVINTKGENNVEDIRSIMGFLNDLARDFNIGLVLIHHLRKKSNFQTPLIQDLNIDDFRGSNHITAMARSVIGLSIIQTTEEPDLDGPRKLNVLKTNLCKHPDPLGFEMVSLHPTGVMLKWGEAPKPYKQPSKEDECKQWLEDMLKQKPMRPKEIIGMGEEEGYSRATIFRARKALGNLVKDTQGRQAPNNLWQWNAKGDNDD